ncbi:MAG: N-acetylmuramoyl-L-alanine amidase [Bifidobacterium pseudolongum]|nr:N-acetylmuramoyl-L-alanine amidase [Bifidobacterium pseudolongum]
MGYEYITKHDAACYTPGRPYGINAITIHWWDDPAVRRPSFETVINLFVTGSRQTSAHYVAEAGRVACLVAPGDRAWACGDGINVGSGGNDKSISIECNWRQSDGDYDTIAQLIADLRKTYGDLPLKPHRNWTNTDCPGTYDLARLDRLARQKAGEKLPTVSTPAKPATTPANGKLSVDQVAREVINGKWGNGADRMAKLKAAGYDAAAVQARVNEICGMSGAAGPAPAANIDAIARDVINGAYGNGADRMNRLKAAGYDPNAVQARVNQMLGANGSTQTAKPAANIDDLARRAIAGEFGNGDARRRALGANYDAVQARVNQMLGQ